MKFCIVSDLHIGIKKSSDVYLKSVSDFFYSQLFPYLQKNAIKNVIVLGDVFDTREAVNVKAMNFVYKLFSMPFNFIILVGNHDLYHKNSSELTSLKILSKFNNVKLVIKPEEIFGMTFVPWIIDEEEFKVYIDSVKTKICFGHFDIDTFSYTGNAIQSHSMSPDLFSKFDKVFSGHFHTRTSKIINNTEITYVGCPYELTRSDIGNQKGFHIFDSDTTNYEFIENTVSPKHIQIKYPADVDNDILTNNFIDIFVDEKDLSNDDAIKSYLKKFNDDSCLQPPTVKIIKADDYLTDELQISDESKSIIELITEYVQKQEVLNKEELIDLLNTVYEEASN